jgi:uncharacterized membrane protein
MENVEMLALVTESPDEAYDALSELKRLEQAGWIDLTYYVLVDRDAAGRVQVEEASEPGEIIRTLESGGLAGDLIGHMFGAPGTAFVASGSALRSRTAGASNGDYAEPDGGSVMDSIAPGLLPGNSALLLVLEERYAERVAEELESRGRTVCKPLDRGERVAALRASIERAKADVQWLDDFLHSEFKKVERNASEGKEDLEATIAAARAELGAQREALHGRWKALAAELEEELEEVHISLRKSEDGNRAALERRAGALEQAVAKCNEELAASVLDHMDGLAAHAAALEKQAAGAGQEVEAAIESQLHDLEVRMRRHRAELTAALSMTATRARRCMDRLGRKAELVSPDLRAAIREHLAKLDERHATFRTSLHHIEKEDVFLWRDFAGEIRQSWLALCDSAAQATRKFQS